MRWKGLWAVIGIAGIVSFCSSVLGSEFENPAEVEIHEVIFEPIPTKDVEIVFVEAKKANVVDLRELPLVGFFYSKSEISKTVRMVMSEGSVLCPEAQQAIAQVPFNRVKSDYKEFKHQTNLTEALEYPNAFSFADNGEPTQACYDAVESVLNYPNAYPEDMLWFNSEHYPDWGYPYMEIDGMYFSTVKNYFAEEVVYE